MIIFCAFSRPREVEGWLERLSAVSYSRKQTDLAFIVDCDSDESVARLNEYGQTHRSVLIRHNAEHIPIESHPNERRKRIAEVKNQSRELIGELEGEIVVSFEDDTVMTMTSLERLTLPFVADQVGFVEGVQCGRWGIKMIGAWRFDNDADPQVIGTLLPNPSGGYEEITGGGFYGYATRRRLYVEAEYGWESWQPWGPDVNFGRYVRSLGYSCWVDWDTRFGHMDYGKVLWPDKDLCEVKFARQEGGGWIRTDRNVENWNPR